MKNQYLQKALRRKSNIEDTLRSKLLSAKRTINTNNSKINKLKLENLSLKQGQGSESRQLKRSLVALRYKYYKSKISYKIHEQKWKKENKELKEKICLMKIENDMLQCNLEEWVREEEFLKCINAKSDDKTYNIACRKAVYCC